MTQPAHDADADRTPRPPEGTPHPPRGADAADITHNTPAKRLAKGRRIMGYLLAAVLIWALAVWFLQRPLMFPRAMIDAPAEARPPADAELWHIDSPAGPVEGWFLPGDGVSTQQPGPAVVFAHGNGELIDHWSAMLEPYRAMGVSVLLAEYRGYGRSAGSPSQAAITRDFIAFHDRLAARQEVDPTRIVYHGRSIGSGAIASLARERKPSAMILQSAFTSAAALVQRYLVPRFMVRDPFEVEAVIERYAGPVLLLHGKRDRIIPLSHAHRLQAAATDGKLHVYEQMGHNDPPPQDAYWEAIERFLAEQGILSAQ